MLFDSLDSVICLCVQYYVWGISSKTEQYCIEAQQINHFDVIGPHITNRSIRLIGKPKSVYVYVVVLYTGYVSRFENAVPGIAINVFTDPKTLYLCTL